MSCYYHSDKDATAICSKCGKSLCTHCGSQFKPITCIDCINVHVTSIRTEMIKNISISIVLMIIGIIVINGPLGILLAGIPYGWSIINRIIPSTLESMSLVIWLAYLFVKLIIAYAIGLIALPIKIFQWISEIKRVERLNKAIHSSK